MTSLLLLADCPEKEREYFGKLLAQDIEAEAVNACHLAHILHSTILYARMRTEIAELEEKLTEVDLHLTRDILEEYL